MARARRLDGRLAPQGAMLPSQQASGGRSDRLARRQGRTGLVASPASGYKVEPETKSDAMAWTRKLTPPVVLRDRRRNAA
jgi:hypothetical protein